MAAAGLSCTLLPASGVCTADKPGGKRKKRMRKKVEPGGCAAANRQGKGSAKDVQRWGQSGRTGKGHNAGGLRAGRHRAQGRKVLGMKGFGHWGTGKVQGRQTQGRYSQVTGRRACRHKVGTFTFTAHRAGNTHIHRAGIHRSQGAGRAGTRLEGTRQGGKGKEGAEQEGTRQAYTGTAHWMGTRQDT
ncbi:hypothetical protein DUNSADRAFT_6293 [Dunaliella salina]|uniref:Uncharacterized protein n=1 Tax=Dunaliella salina TaxID=3046 RepID=A0ABQ7GNJ1_DUNSA|nr:hypothetical protein DUNSADRAFT_6293 [Dunaliella salina]|eukprot:KAF5836184.1 hypothetical protein DUNSADRAFT_6293 [Dunaliella salina]